MWKTGEPPVYGNYIVMLKDGTTTMDYYASFGWDDNGSNVVAYTDYLDQCDICDEDICNNCIFLKQVYDQTPILHFDGSTIRVLEPMDKRIVGPNGGELVEVVRCKDCKYRDKVHTYRCNYLYDVILDDGDGFCSHGERRENGETN